MRSFRDTFEKRKRSFISAFSICMTAPLINNLLDEIEFLKNGLRSKDTTINLIIENSPRYNHYFQNNNNNVRSKIGKFVTPKNLTTLYPFTVLKC